MRVLFESNEKFGEGYQVRLTDDDGRETVLDFRPYTWYEAVRMTRKAISMVESREGRKINPSVLIDREALKRNSGRDLESRRIFERLKAGEAEDRYLEWPGAD